MAAAFPAAAVSIDTWKFTPLVADTIGRWHSKAQETIKLLSERLPIECRSTMVSLWRQRLSTVLQMEGHRVVVQKIQASAPYTVIHL